MKWLHNSARWWPIVVLILAISLAACAPAASQTPAAPAPTGAPGSTPAPAAPAAPVATSAPTSSGAQATSAATGQTPGSTPAPSGTEGAAPSAANTLVYAANISDLITVDPATMYAWSGILVVHNLYETLVRFEGTDLSTVKPGLAEKWDIKDAGDHWELTFNLRSGVRFASGNEMTADDVVYSFQRVIALKQGPSFLFTNVAGLKPDSVKATDPQTVVISMPKTASPQVFLSILTFTVGSIVDSKEVKAHEANGDSGNGWLLDHSAGSGPYVLDHWTKETEVLLKANPNYGGNKPALPNVLIQHVLESTNQQFGLERGDIDIARNLSPEQIATLQGKPDVTSATGNSLLLVYMGMNQTVKPLDNPQVREAIRTVIDYNGIVNDLLRGNAKKVQTLIPEGLLGFNPDAPFQQDVAKAKDLLKQAGQDKGFTLELLVPSGAAPGGAAWSDIAAKLQADLAQINITLNIKQTTYAELYDIYRAQKHQLIAVEWGPDYPDPDGNINPFVNFKANSIAQRNNWNDPALGEKAVAAALETDAAKRVADYKEITEAVLHGGPYAVLYQPSEVFGLRSNVKGFQWKAIGWVDFAEISK